MAGGSGTRLWPASTSKRPKQFLSLPPDVSFHKPGKEKISNFFSAALDRAFSVIDDSADSHVIVIAGKDHINHIINDCSELDEHDRKRLILVPEPLARNTAPAIACALLYLDWVSSGRERNTMVLTCDHIIKPPDVFKTDSNAAAAMAQADKLVVFGIQPDRPETGYGYVEAAETMTVSPAENQGGIKRYEPEVFSVASFREKPDRATAQSYIDSKKFFWNSGMFAFSSKFMLAEFQHSAPDVIVPFRELWAPKEHSHHIVNGIKILEQWDNMEEAYKKTRAISFDYAIAEKCRQTVMVKAGFSWTDVGSWDEYSRLAIDTGSEVYGKAESCFVDSDIPVALCGVEDLIVVVRSGKDGSPPAALISKKGKTQHVREIVEEIKAAGKTELL